jgi:hypothetical protein
MQQSDESLQPEAPTALECVLREVETSLNNGLFYVALAVTLTIPDICAGLECDPDRVWVTEKKYIAWLEANLTRNYEWFTAEDCARLRHGVVHTGGFGHPKKRYERVMFTLPAVPIALPARTREVLSEGFESAPGSVLTMNLEGFCCDMLRAARAWERANATNPTVLTNMAKLVRFRPDGVPPWVIGAPMIA